MLIPYDRAGSFCVLTFAMDESADGQRKKVFVVGGFLGTPERWFDAERYWEARVKMDGLSYFHTGDCIKLSGEFEEWKTRYGKAEARRKANELLDDLKSIVKASQLQFACLVVPIADYAEVMAEPDGARVLESDPYLAAYREIIYRIARISGNSSNPRTVAYLFDEHTKAAQLVAGWSAFKSRHPVAAAFMGTIAPLDDKTSPCIQIADLIAHSTRKTYEERIDKNANDMTYMEEWKPMALWLTCWDKAYLREVVSYSVAVAEGKMMSAEREWDHMTTRSEGQ